MLYYYIIQRDRSSPEEIEQTTMAINQVCLYPFMVLEQSVSGSYFTTRHTHSYTPRPSPTPSRIVVHAQAVCGCVPLPLAAHPST